MAESKLSILVQALGAAKAAKELKGVDKAVSNIGARAGQGLRTAGSNLKTLGVIAGGIVATGLVASVKAAADFESQLNTINTIARATPEGLDAIGDSIRKIARDTGIPLEDLTQGYYDLLSAGIKAADATNVLEAANRLSIGGLSTSAEAVDLLTTAINVYGGDASKAAQFSDEFAKAIERGKVTAADLAASYAQVAPLAKELGIDNAELAAGYARLTASGTDASEAATQMASALTALLKKTPDLEKLEKATDKNYAAIAGSKGLNVALEEMRTDADKAGIALVDLVGRKEALLYILQTTGPNLAAYNADLAAMGDAAGTAAGQMAERQKGLNFQLARLKALAIDAGITIGSKLLPKLTPLAEKAVLFLTTHEADIERFGDKIASGFDRAFEFATKIPWDQIGAGLEVAATWAGKLMDVFLAMPPEVQTTLIALAGLNKLSGGAITGIVGELGKGLIKGVLGINAAVVNVNGGVVNGAGGKPGLGGPGAAVAGAGGFLAPGAVAAAAAAAVPLVMLNAIPFMFKGEKGSGIIGDISTPTGTVSESQRQTLASLSPAFERLIAAQAGVQDVKVVNQPKSGGLSPDERQALNDQRQKMDQQYTAVERNRGAIDLTRSNIVSATAAQTSQLAAATASQTAQLIAAISRMRPTVNVNVTNRANDDAANRSNRSNGRQVGLQAS